MFGFLAVCPVLVATRAIVAAAVAAKEQVVVAAVAVVVVAKEQVAVAAVVVAAKEPVQVGALTLVHHSCLNQKVLDRRGWRSHLSQDQMGLDHRFCHSRLGPMEVDRRFFLPIFLSIFLPLIAILPLIVVLHRYLLQFLPKKQLFKHMTYSNYMSRVHTFSCLPLSTTN